MIKRMKMIIYSRFLKKDIMYLKIQSYRDMGAKIGENVRSFSPITSSEPYLIEIGNNVTISSEVNFITHDNSIGKIIPNMTDAFGKIIIKDNCFIGLGSILLPGIVIGENTIVAAGSVVTKSFATGNVVIGGNPAKIICKIDVYRDKIKDYCLCTKEMNFNEKRHYLEENQQYFLKK